MWWTTKSDRRGRFTVVRQQRNASGSPVSPRSAARLRFSRLPISNAQATANLILQETGADGFAEIKRLKEDIRALETAFEVVLAEKSQAVNHLFSIQQPVARVNEVHDQADPIHPIDPPLHDPGSARNHELQKWCMLAVEELLEQAKQHQVDGRKLQQKITSLREALQTAASERQAAASQVDLIEREKKILAEVIHDMESRHDRDLLKLRQECDLLRNRLRKSGQQDRTQVQDLNMRIVSQAAEIRSLKQLVSDQNAKDSSPGSGYVTVLDHEARENADCAESTESSLTERLEKSLDAARVELDSAVHELRYATAENLRLKSEADCVHEQYEAECRCLVMVAQLHAALAAASGETILRGEMNESFSGRSVDEITAVVPESDRGAGSVSLVQDEQIGCKSIKAASLPIHDDALHSHKEGRELDVLRESLARQAGQNDLLSAENELLNQQLKSLQHELDGSRKIQLQEKKEWQLLLEHHERNTSVAHAECALVTSQLDEGNHRHQKELNKHLQAMEALKADLSVSRTSQNELQSELDGANAERMIAMQQMERLQKEASQLRSEIAELTGDVRHRVGESVQDKDELGRSAA